MKKFLVIFYIFHSTFLFAQPALPKNIADSLWNIWNDESKPDTVRLKAIDDYGWEGYLFSQPDSAFYYAQLALDFAKKRNLKKPQANALGMQGVSFYVRGDYDKALKYYAKALKINEELNYQTGISSSLTNMAGIYQVQGNFVMAIEYYSRSLKMDEKAGNRSGISTGFSNLGTVFKEQKEYKKALEYYQKSRKLAEEVEDYDGVGISYNNIGVVYAETQDYEKAKKYFVKALRVYEKTGYKSMMGNCYNNIGQINKDLGYLDSALFYLEMGYKISEEVSNVKAMANSSTNISNIYFTKGEFSKAMQYAKRANQLASEIGAVEESRDASWALYKNFKRENSYKDALLAFETYIEMRDSLQSDEASRAIISHEFKYKYETKAATDSVKAKKDRMIEEEKSKALKEELARKRTQQFAMVGGLLILLVFGGFMYNRFKVTQRQKQVIEVQKHMVEEKNKEISDSINYAKRLQEAILPSRYSLTESLKNGFVLFKPKDIVSGDFYWLEKVKVAGFSGNKTATATENSELIFFAAADCTGHGVPGAMVSVICSNAISKALLEENILDTGKILDRTRELIIDKFSKSDEEVKDGMDVSLCSLNGNKLQWSGANNALWIVKRGTGDMGQETGEKKYSLTEFKPDKQPVGKSPNPKPFTSHEISLEKGDTIYIFTDGYQDQFGGDSGKKFKAANLKEMLLSIQDKTMDEQKEYLNASFEKWRGNLEQVDDVCIIGVRV